MVMHFLILEPSSLEQLAFDTEIRDFCMYQVGLYGSNSGKQTAEERQSKEAEGPSTDIQKHFSFQEELYS